MNTLAPLTDFKQWLEENSSATVGSMAADIVANYAAAIAEIAALRNILDTKGEPWLVRDLAYMLGTTSTTVMQALTTLGFEPRSTNMEIPLEEATAVAKHLWVGGEMNELLDLMIKSGRRCAYDLQHSVDLLSTPSLSAEFIPLLQTRANHWKSVFNPANGPKDYQSKLHSRIERLERLLQEIGHTEF